MAADPTDPTNTDNIAQHTAAVEADTAAVQGNTEAARASGEVMSSVQRQMSSLNNILGNVGNVLGNVTDSYLNARRNMREGLFTAEDARNVGLTTTALLGVRNTFDQFSGLHIDREAFLAPISDMEKALKEGGGALNFMADNILSTFGKIMPDSVKTSSEAVVKFGMNLLRSADNAIHMRDAVIQLAASSGNLNRVFTAAGPGLEHINEIMAQQSDEISNVASTMNISRGDAVKYYSELGKVPGALTATVPASEQLFKGMDNSIANSSGQIDMLTATIALAKGTGRDFGDVVRDLTVAFRDYGLTGEKALSFSVNMSEISNNLGIDLQSVQSSLSGGAQSFREFADAGERSADMAEGLAKLTNEYSQALKNQGLSGNVALEVAQSMTSELSKMTIAQKAFLSAQTGGPGGLMGAFQIEKELREGKIEDVFKRVRAQMQRQLGGIVTLDDAAKNPAAAAQLTRQIMTLQRGPLGQFAKTDQEAYRILEAFKAGDKGIKALAPDALKGAMDKGVILQDQSRTLLSELRADSERQLALTDQTNLLLAQQLAAATGSREKADSRAQEVYRDSLRAARSNAAERAEQMTERTATAVGTGKTPGMGVDLGVDSTREGLTQNTGKIVSALSNVSNKIVGTFIDKTEKELSHIKDQINSETDPNVKAALERKMASKMQERAVMGQGTMLDAEGKLPTASGAVLGGALNTAINAPLSTAPRTGVSTTNMIANKQNTPVDHVGTLGDINVHVTGYCIRCKQEIEGGSQMTSVSTPAKRTSPS